jgi:hypothetical protein
VAILIVKVIKKLLCCDICNSGDVVTVCSQVHGIGGSYDLLFQGLVSCKVFLNKLMLAVFAKHHQHELVWMMVEICGLLDPPGSTGAAPGLTGGGTHATAESVLHSAGKTIEYNTPSWPSPGLAKAELALSWMLILAMDL